MRIEKLDALRGVAALVVVVQHAMEQVIGRNAFAGPVQSGLEVLFKTGMNFGRFGVAMFFLISGFVIPFSFRGDRPIIAFGVSRFFRLYPAYWISLLFALAVIAATARHMPSNIAIFANSTMLQRFVGIDDIVGAYWTLSIELMFYIACAVMFAVGWLNLTSRLLVVILVLLGVSIAGGLTSMALGRHLPSGVPLHLSLMFLGTLMRRGWLDDDSIAQRCIVPLVSLLIIAIPVIQWSSYPENTITQEYIRPFAFTTGYYLALAIFIITMTRNVSFTSTWVWLGGISYAVYVLHGSFLNLCATFLAPDTPIRALAFLIVLFVGTIGTSALVFYLVEKPFVRIGHRIMALLTGSVPTIKTAV